MIPYLKNKQEDTLMLLGRRKTGFTEEVTLRPDEIPDYVNEENDTTFRRPATCAPVSDAQDAQEEWVCPPPMPQYRLLREYIRAQSGAACITPRSALLAEDPQAEQLLAQIAQDADCADIVALEGQQDTYYYSSQAMSRFVAWITMLVLEDDLPRLIAEVTRHNCVTYPAPTLVDYFTLSPFRYLRDRIDEALRAMQTDSRYQDIRPLLSANEREYLYSAEKMSEKYAYALANDMDRGPVD